MRLIVPYVEGGLQEETKAALVRDGQKPELYGLRGMMAYYDLLERLWDASDDLVIVEQDIVVRPGCIAEMLACEHDWCKFGYWYPPFGYYGGLGCVRFSRFLQHWVPDAVRQAGLYSDAGHPPKHWCRLDFALQQVLIRAGEHEHYHQPPVTHLGDRADNRCEPGIRSHDDIA